ncbi:precorrin-2 dehydrogenase/sirohydrochlorin ferrochelatase family protein [Haloprofundus halobius]|uniref:precorrin-2 dehydrogenase/sirohydrochlorin ferrochelatase family protein n=1 Tax=Haloprofundus halobius TaxID=2876194 RepID=UPI001CC9711B|nr:bifunctional precorrin-2 dehydrogenase/sirohydrochlorin ferrochelatase [Haloprofundus halobius]
MIPLFHDFTNETVLVFGGGAVGARKARRFATEAHVVVVSPEFGDGEVADDEFGGAELVRAAPAPGEIAEWVDRFDPVLVVAATDDEAVNAAAEAAARDAGILVNRTDRAGSRDAGSVVVPATVEDGPVTVAISTGGRSPALSKQLRERIETRLDGAGAMAELTGEIRTELKAAGVAPDERREALRAVVASSSVWKALRTGESKARQEAQRVIRNRGESP